MSETQASYDGDRLPAIKAAYGTWLDGAIRDALYAWHDAHRAWYAATNPHRIATGGPRFDAAHRAMAVAWGRLVRLLDAARPGDDDGAGS